MRVIAIGIALLAGGGMRAAAAPVAMPAIMLDGGGVTVGGTRARFAVATKAQAIALVAGALGRPTKQGVQGDCGQRDILSYARFRGGFELSFVKGRLSGWTADGASPRTTKNIAVGATVAALRRAYPDVYIDKGDEANGGIGPNFQREGGPNGWIDGTRPTAKVTGLFAGATCLAGI